MSNLLKYARAKDDQNFIWRIAAAMMVHAQEIEHWELSEQQRALVTWVMLNPMVAHQIMVNHVSTNTAIAANVIVENGAINTDSVPDDDIQYVVNQAWDAVAVSAF
jgi:hypothetical protein